MSTLFETVCHPRQRRHFEVCMYGVSECEGGKTKSQDSPSVVSLKDDEWESN